MDGSFGDPSTRNEARNSGLHCLSLSGNKFTSASVVALGKHLRRNQWIVGINFSGNQIDSLGIAHLAKSLDTNTTLHTLVLSNNPGYRERMGQACSYTFEPFYLS